MRAGKHWVTFKSEEPNDLEQFVGVTRPLSDWDNLSFLGSNILEERTDRWKGQVDYCEIYLWRGRCDWYSWSTYGWRGEINAGFYCQRQFEEWEGRDNYDFSRGTLNMLLDLDRGTLSIYQNGQRVGIVKDGLEGEYCWVVGLRERAGHVSIKRGYHVSNS